MKILVLGGSGYVGSYIVKELLKHRTSGIQSVSSFSRKTEPHPSSTWIKGNALDKSSLQSAISGGNFDCVVSCLGAFGTNEFMEKICGDATIDAAEISQKSGVKRFIFVSEASVPTFEQSGLSKGIFPYGYFSGKRRAEMKIKELYSDKNGVILRPGFIYGWRKVGPVSIPLHFVGIPFSIILKLIYPILKYIPGFGMEFQSFVSVESLAKAVVHAAINGYPQQFMDSTSISSFK